MRQVLRAGALGRPRGMGWRGRQEGESGWGTHVNPWLIYVNVWQKPLQYCKVISLQLIYINEKKMKKIHQKKNIFPLFFNLFFSCVIFFYWTIIALQNFVVFCQMSTWIIHQYTYGPSLLTFKNISKCFPIKLLWLQKSLPNILISITSSWIYSPYHWEWTSKNGFCFYCRKDFNVLYPHSPWKPNYSTQNVFKVRLNTTVWF